jgi:hypothetical protein
MGIFAIRAGGGFSVPKNAFRTESPAIDLRLAVRSVATPDKYPYSRFPIPAFS